MRELTSHKVNGCNDAIRIQVADEPSHGGACHRYVITHRDGQTVQAYAINFQNGPINVVGTNGLTHESLLAILIDRLEGFQHGPYACDENAAALQYILDAQDVLKERTKARLARGVEGTHTV